MSNAIVTVESNVTAPIQYNLDVSILAGQVTDSTKALYAKTLAKYVAFAGSSVEALKPTTLVKYRQYLVNDKGLAAATINRELSSIKSVLKVAAQSGFISFELYEQFKVIEGASVNALKDRQDKHARTTISKEDMRRLVDAPNTKHATGKMHKALLLTLASTGMRISEIVTLKVSQIVSNGIGYKVTGIYGKTDSNAGGRECTISNEAVEAINAWVYVRTIDSEFVFTRTKQTLHYENEHITTVSGWELVQKYAEQCGLEHIKPHDFRRFVGTRLAKDNIRNAQKALGHKRIETTAAHYVLDDLPMGLTDNLY